MGLAGAVRIKTNMENASCAYWDERDTGLLRSRDLLEDLESEVTDRELLLLFFGGDSLAYGRPMYCIYCSDPLASASC